MLPRRSLRLSLAVTALFLLTGGGRAAGMLPCPLHDGGPPAPAPAGQHAGHDSAPADDRAPAHGHCDCAGVCQPDAPPVPAGHAAAPTPAPAPRLATTASDRGPAARFTPYTLPYSTAPPVAG